MKRTFQRTASQLRRHLCHICLLTLACFVPLIGFAQAPLPNDIATLTKKHVQKLNTYFYLDRNNAISSSDESIMSLMSTVPWQRLTDITTVPRISNFNSWFVIPIVNKADHPNTAILDASIPRVPEYEVWVIIDDRIENHLLLGTNYPYDNRIIDTRNVRIPAMLESKQSGYVILRVNEYAFSLIDEIRLVNIDQYVASTDYREWYEWFIYGALMLLIVHNTLIYIATRQSIYLFYVGLVAAILINTVSLRGYGDELLWGNWPWLVARIDRVSTILVMAMAGFFSCSFLQLKSQQPRLHKFIQTSSAVFLFCSVIPLVLHDYMRPVHLAAMVVLIPFYSLLLIAGLKSVRLRVSGALVFSLSMVIYLISIISLTTQLTTSGRYSGLYVETGQLMQLLLLSVALTSKLQELRLKEQIAIAENQAKSRFLAKMSHEIRTPMNGILGMAELMNRTTLDETQRSYNNMIEYSSHMLLAIINDILDYSKIEAGKMVLEQVEFDLHELAIGVMQLMKPQIAEKNIELDCTIETGVPEYVLGDPSRLRQVLTNLLSNAAKFTELGKVTLSLSPGNGPDHVRFCVLDTGAGFDAQTKEKLFGSFEQADSSIARKYGGTGLGLAICKELIHLMAGEIHVESTPSQGSQFIIDVPLAKAEATTSDTQIASALDNVNLLLVEDFQDYAQNVARYCASLGVKIDTTSSDAVSRAPLSKHYKLIILSISKEETHSLEPVQRLRHIAGEAPPFIVLSYSNERPSVEHKRALNIADWVEKPALPSTLLHCCSTSLGLSIRENMSQDAAPIELNRGKSLNILVAEDNPTNQFVIRSILDKLGHKVTIVNNGQEAIEHFQKECPDLILMDCEMPEVDGYTATIRIREMENANEHTPIIALTAHALAEARQQCLDSGMDDYVVKPISLQLLNESLSRYQ